MLKQEGYDLMGAAFEVYNELGYGMAEDIYQQSLEVELGLRQVPFVPHAELDVYFKQHLLPAKYRPDLLVFGEIVVELKSLKEICSGHEAQLFNYMRIARKRVGYLINFANRTLIKNAFTVMRHVYLGVHVNCGTTASRDGGLATDGD